MSLAKRQSRQLKPPSFSSARYLAGFFPYSPVAIGPRLQTTVWFSLLGCVGRGRRGGWLDGGTVDPWVAFWWVFFGVLCQSPTQTLPSLSLAGSCCLDRALRGGCIQPKRGQESRFCLGKSMPVLLMEEKICRDEWKATAGLAEGLGGGL